MKTEYLTLSDLGAIFKKRLIPILAVILLLAFGGFAIRAFLPAQYSATATFYVRNLQSEAFLSQNGLTSSQLASVQTLAKEYATLVTESDGFLDRLIERHALPLSREELRASLDSAPASTQFTVTATSAEAGIADDVIEAVEAELPQFIQETAWPNLSLDFTCVVLLRSAAPAARSSAHPLLWAGVGAFGGLALSYLFFLFKFLFGNRLADAREIARVAPGLSLLGSIPAILPPDDAAESFYALRERLPRSEGGAVPLALTSALSGEGKSYVTMGLARSLAVAGKRVLVIDADLRGGAKDACFLPDAEPGFSEYLAGKVKDVKKLIHQTSSKGVSLLPVGLLPISPCDHPLSERMAALLATFSSEYDYIIADFPATAEAVDAAVCAPDFSATLLVAAPGKCGARELRGAISAIQSTGARLLGLIANSVPEARDLPQA